VQSYPENRVVKRRLAAIVYADVVGYSLLMQRDRSGTHAQVKSLGSNIVGRYVELFDGRIVKTMGDGFLLEFQSGSDAFDACLSIQQELDKKNDDTALEDVLRLRMGIHVGEVLIDEGDVFGEGVIIASRLEGLAEPGGVLVSRAVYDNIEASKSKLLVSVGKFELKNISEPVEGWQWTPSNHRVSPPLRLQPGRKESSRPSLAVMLFQNLSSEDEQQYFVSGICEDLQSTLSKSQLFDVVARSSSFAFDPAAVDPQQVGRLLDARYVVQGHVRRAGNRIRVGANLVDTEHAKEVWSDRLDGEIDNIFDLQDKITAALASAIIPEITRAEIERTRSDRIENLSSWDLYLRALPLMQETTNETNRAAIELLGNAIDLQASFSSALAMLCRCHVTAAYQMWGESPEQESDRARKAAIQAIKAGPDNPLAYDARAALHVYEREFDEAILCANRAKELDPSLASAYGSLAAALALNGCGDEALEVCKAADHVSPRDPDRSQRQMAIVIAYFVNENYQAAVIECQKYILIRPNWFGVYTFLAASLIYSDQHEAAFGAIKKLLEIIPGYTIEKQKNVRG